MTEPGNVVLGVAGGIAAYKACELLRLLTESGHEVTVVPTPAALEFVGAPTWAALSGRPVHTGVFADADAVPHVRLGQQARLIVVAPATADLLARAATGRADDLLTNVLLTARCPVLYAPAMHSEMWLHPATRANVATLRERGAVVLEPDTGRLTGADSGPGRLPDPAEIFAVADVLTDPAVARAAATRDLSGLTVAVSAGGTREHLDPVRFLGNSSSGRMGFALARAAALRGARVRLVSATAAPRIPTVEAEAVTSTADLAEAMVAAQKEADLVVMAAAPADFTAASYFPDKIKKTGPGDAVRALELVQTTDVLADLVRRRTDPAQVIVGLAAETTADHDELVARGEEKLARKGCDLLVLNRVGRDLVFGQPTSEVTLLAASGAGAPQAGSKDVLAHRIWDAALALRRHR